MTRIKGHPSHYTFPDEQNDAIRNWIYRFIAYVHKLHDPEKVTFT